MRRSTNGGRYRNCNTYHVGIVLTVPAQRHDEAADVGLEHARQFIFVLLVEQLRQAVPEIKRDVRNLVGKHKRNVSLVMQIRAAPQLAQGYVHCPGSC